MFICAAMEYRMPRTFLMTPKECILTATILLIYHDGSSQVTLKEILIQIQYMENYNLAKYVIQPVAKNTTDNGKFYRLSHNLLAEDDEMKYFQRLEEDETDDEFTDKVDDVFYH